MPQAAAALTLDGSAEIERLSHSKIEGYGYNAVAVVLDLGPRFVPFLKQFVSPTDDLNPPL